MTLAEEYLATTRAAVWLVGPEEGDVTYTEELVIQPKSLKETVASVFLPEGFPASVTPDYLSFQVWDSLQATCSYIRGILTSQAILTGVGVGQQVATPLSAVFQFFVRDLSGMCGGILFAFFQGSNMDTFAKQWRLFADCLNNVGLILELASPLFPSWFLLLACLGSIARAITGVAGGATRAALTQHFAKQRNLADIAAKEGSQETATTLLGMLLGMAFTHAFGEIQFMVWAAFSALTVLHVFANMRALRCLRLTTLNRSRADCLLANYLREGRVLTPTEVAQKEGLVPPPLLHLLRLLTRQPVVPVRLGVRLSEVVGLSAIKLKEVCEQAFDNAYILHVRNGAVLVVLHTNATNLQVLEAYVHATQLAEMLSEHHIHKGIVAVEEAADWMHYNWEHFEHDLLAAGWNLERLDLGADQWRARWNKDAAHAHPD